MSPLLYPLVAVAAMGAIAIACWLAYLLRWVLLVAGGVGLLFAIGGGIVSLIDGTQPDWIAYLALGSLGACLIGIVMEDTA